MKISYLWLLDYIDLPASPQELRDSLSAVGLVVESVQPEDDDTVLDVEVPSNRPDCLSHIGIARELAAVYDCDLKIPSPVNPASDGRFPIAIEDPVRCRRYSARVIRGVRIQESPPWMKKRLTALGQRPINNIVDTTNYVLLEMGHPLHAFDLDRLQGPEIVVRGPRPGETLRTLDGVRRELSPDDLVIADGREPVALAGVMGGERSEISGDTSDLLIESAYFDPISIGRTARRFQMRTEASHRFERGANLEGTVAALERCVELILKLAGGSVGSPVIDLLPDPRVTQPVRLRRERMEKYALVGIPDDFVQRTLSRLGFRMKGIAGGWTVEVPSHRIDVLQEEDLIEEVLRHFGYDRIPSTFPLWKGKGGFLPERERRFRLAELLRSMGYSEALNWTLMDPAVEGGFEYGESPVILKNPLSADASQLRTHLVPNLALAVRHNQNHGQERVRLFEIGKVFAQLEGRVQEKEHVAWVATGAESRKYWDAREDPVNYFYMKGVLESLAQGLGQEPPELRPARASFLSPAQSAEIYRNGRPAGCLGCLHPELQEILKLKQPLFLGEFELETAQAVSRQAVFKPLSRYPGVFRDFSFLVDRRVAFDALAGFVSALAAPHLSRMELIDLYDSQQLPPGKTSLAVRFFFESAERTLTDQEIEAARDQIVQSLQSKFGVIPR